MAAVGLLAGALMTSPIGRAQDGEAPALPQWTAAESQRGYVVFACNPMEKVAASYVPDRNAVVEDVSCTLARDEYESVQIGVCALADDLKDIRLTVESDLDVTVYHRIDPDVKQELAGSEMSWISWMDSAVYLERANAVKELPKGQSVNFWLTFHAGPEAPDGLHTGKVRIKPAGKPVTVIDLKVRVRPFRLPVPRAAFGMYYREDMLPERFGRWSIADQVELAIYRDMTAHGQNSVSFFMAGDFSELPPKGSRLLKCLGLAREAGLIHADVPCVLVQGNIADIEEEQRKAAVAWLQAQRLEEGWPEMVNYGWDEPPVPAPGMRERYLPMREVSMRLGTAMDATAAYAYGDMHDVWIVIGGEVTPEMRAEAARLGAQVWTYSYRIWREGFEPLRQRFYAGLYTWAHRLGGNFVWAYSHGHHGHAWWLPGSDESMPITAWEERREGVDDYRYLQMVEDCVAANDGDPVAAEATQWIDALRVRLTPADPHLAEAGKPLAFDEYDEIRAKASDYVEKLGPTVDRREPWPVTNLKDEGKAFRGKSVDDCIAGLADSDTSERRGAAWALFELGPKATPAVNALVEALDDPEVRVPALRALEAIGPRAYPAVPELASLLSDPDAYVRLGATLTLAGVARPPSWDDDLNGYLPDDLSAHVRTLVPPLRQALRDGDHAVVKLAALGLFRCGEAAAPALPDAMGLLGLGDDGRPRDDGSLREFGLRVLSGMGPGAASAVPVLTKAYEESKGRQYLIVRTLAAIGPAASEAVPVLEKYRTSENPYLADTCYALYCIRGGESELKTMAELVGDGSRTQQEWATAARFLMALGSEAAPVASLVRERLALLETPYPALKRRIESTFFKRVEEGATPLRLLLR